MRWGFGFRIAPVRFWSFSSHRLSSSLLSKAIPGGSRSIDLFCPSCSMVLGAATPLSQQPLSRMARVSPAFGGRGILTSSNSLECCQCSSGSGMVVAAPRSQLPLFRAADISQGMPVRASRENWRDSKVLAHSFGLGSVRIACVGRSSVRGVAGIGALRQEALLVSGFGRTGDVGMTQGISMPTTAEPSPVTQVAARETGLLQCRGWGNSGRKRGAVACRASGGGERAVAADGLCGWLKEQGFPDQAVAIKVINETEGLGCVATRPLQTGEVALRVPENYCVTAFDVNNHPFISGPAKARGDLIGLTLWLMYEKLRGQASLWYPLVKLFPESTTSPLLWSPADQDKLLKGSPVLAEVKERVAVLEEVYEELKSGYFDKDPQSFPEESFSLIAFKNAFSVILSRALYLPSADIFALVPYGDCINHKGDSKAYLDFDTEDGTVVLTVDREYKAGEQVFINYGQDRPNADLLISYGFVDPSNENDYLEITVELLEGDRLKDLKQQILQQAGFDSPESFPLFADRFPTQLLTYMRLSRLADVGLFAKITFDQDVIIDQANEYEILMLLMGECRVALQEYTGSTDEESRIANDKQSTAQEKLAAQLRLAEKKILINSMSALRNRLAPIRGIPVKGGGLKDPNSDIMEMFDMAEQIASAPSKFLSNIFKK